MKFRKRPVVIDAVQWKGYNVKECVNHCESIIFNHFPNATILMIPTLEGNMSCEIDDWIIRGVNGEFYPCKPDVFEKTYEAVNEKEPQ